MNSFKLRFILPAIAMLLVMAVVVPGTSEAGKKWSGADPIFTVNGERFNVRIEWPSEFNCDIRGVVNVKVYVEKGAAVNFHSESTANFNGCEVRTKTKVLSKLKENNMGLEVNLRAKEDFSVKAKIDRNGFWVAEFEGSSNRKFRGIVNLEDETSLIVDPALPFGYNGEQYSYDDDIYSDSIDNRRSLSRFFDRDDSNDDDDDRDDDYDDDDDDDDDDDRDDDDDDDDDRRGRKNRD